MKGYDNLKGKREMTGMIQAPARSLYHARHFSLPLRQVFLAQATAHHLFVPVTVRAGVGERRREYGAGGVHIGQDRLVAAQSPVPMSPALTCQQGDVCQK